MLLPLALTLLCALPPVAPVAPDVASSIGLGRHLEVLVLDAGDTLDAEAAVHAAFTPVERDVPSWGFGARVIWARFRTAPHAQADARWLLRAGFPRPDRIDLYQRGPDGRLVKRAHAGAFEQQGAFAQDIILPIDVNAGEHLLRIEVQPARINLHLVEERTLAALRADEMLVAGVYYGIFLGLFLYNLFLGFSLRDGTHALYCVFLVCMSLHIAARDGLGFNEAPDAIGLGGVGLNMTSLIMLVFARRFLRLNEPARDPQRARRFPRLNRVITAELAVCAVLVVLAFGGAPLAAVSAATSAVTIGTVVVAAVLVAREGDVPARWFLVAWSVLIASCVWSVVHAFGWTDASVLTVHGMKLGSALEMVLLSLALAARVRALRAEKERAELALASARAEAQAELAGRVIQAQEEERARYARELHDGLGHALLTIKERAAQAVRKGAGLDVDEARLVGAEAQQCIDDARAMARNLVPPSLSRLGLVEALRGVCADTTEASAIEVTFDDEHARGLDDIGAVGALGDRAIHVVRIVQEALTNAVRHGHAPHATVSVRAVPGELFVEITDDGAGFDTRVAAAARGLGRLDMEQRAKLLGGELTLESNVGRGTRVACRLPYETVAHAPAPSEIVGRAPVAHAAVPHAAVPHATAPHATAPHATVPHATVPHATVPHATAAPPLREAS